MSIHQRIRERRLALGLPSHQALADLVGVSWQTVQLWEKEGGTAPNRGRIKKVAEVLGVTPEWLQHGVASEKQEGTQPVGNVAIPSQPSAKLIPFAPKWMDAEAFRLLELYYLADADGRAGIMTLAEIHAGAQSVAAGNER